MRSQYLSNKIRFHCGQIKRLFLDEHDFHELKCEYFHINQFKHLFWVLKRSVSDCSLAQHMFYLRNTKIKFELHTLI